MKMLKLIFFVAILQFYSCKEIHKISFTSSVKRKLDVEKLTKVLRTDGSLVTVTNVFRSVKASKHLFSGSHSAAHRLYKSYKKSARKISKLSGTSSLSQFSSSWWIFAENSCNWQWEWREVIVYFLWISFNFHHFLDLKFPSVSIKSLK